MDFLTIIGIAVGLALDAFAVSICCGLTIKNLRVKEAIKIGAFFGGFQAVMPIIGWFVGVNLRKLISDLDHWIVFTLLLMVGGRMIYEAFKADDCRHRINPLEIKTLLLLSLVTSIDALAAGLTFAFLKIAIITPAIVIGLITFTACFYGALGGKKIGGFFRRKVEIAGALILIAIGIKILIQHLTKNI